MAAADRGAGDDGVDGVVGVVGAAAAVVLAAVPVTPATSAATPSPTVATRRGRRGRRASGGRGTADREDGMVDPFLPESRPAGRCRPQHRANAGDPRHARNGGSPRQCLTRRGARRGRAYFRYFDRSGSWLGSKSAGGCWLPSPKALPVAAFSGATGSPCARFAGLPDCALALALLRLRRYGPCAFLPPPMPGIPGMPGMPAAGHLLHHLAGLEEPVDEAVDLGDGDAGTLGDARRGASR